MAFTAADVKTLREMTSVGMMDCKKALVECDGDMDKAVEWLREKGLAKAAKKVSRIAAEGMSYALTENGVGVVVEVNCETDFCAKSDLFVAFVKDIAKVIAEQNPADVDALMNCKYVGSELTVSETMPEKVMSIGENLQIRRFVRFSENTSVGYVHAGGKIGVLVNLAVEGGIDATEIGKNVAMQIAALNPRFWDKSQVTDEVLAEEKKDRSGSDGHRSQDGLQARGRQGEDRHGQDEQVLRGELPAADGVRPQRHLPGQRGEVYRRRRQEAGRLRQVRGRRSLPDRRGHREEAGGLRRRGRCSDEHGQVIANTEDHPSGVSRRVILLFRHVDLLTLRCASDRSRIMRIIRGDSAAACPSSTATSSASVAAWNIVRYIFW